MRADTVGSLLRPPKLKAARERHVAGDISAAEFKRIEDRAVDEAVRLQEEAGLEVVTDGEMRRVSFQSQLAVPLSKRWLIKETFSIRPARRLGSDTTSYNYHNYLQESGL